MGTVCSGCCSGCGDLRRGCWLGDAGEREVSVRGRSMECSETQSLSGLWLSKRTGHATAHERNFSVIAFGAANQLHWCSTRPQTSAD